MAGQIQNFVHETIREEGIANPKFSISDRDKEAWEFGFHVSVLDPYPEGA